MPCLYICLYTASRSKNNNPRNKLPNPRDRSTYNLWRWAHPVDQRTMFMSTSLPDQYLEEFSGQRCHKDCSPSSLERTSVFYTGKPFTIICPESVINPDPFILPWYPMINPSTQNLLKLLLLCVCMLDFWGLSIHFKHDWSTDVLESLWCFTSAETSGRHRIYRSLPQSSR